jgi:hypothetical protein
MRYPAAIALIAAFAFAFGTAGTASAKGCGGGAKHHGNPAVSQYVEKIPTACGSKGDRGSAGSTQLNASSLSPAVNLQLNRSAQGKLLKLVAASRRFGAPPIPERMTHQQPNNPSALSASVSAVSSGSHGGLIALLVVMAVVALSVVGVAVYRRRAPR